MQNLLALMTKELEALNWDNHEKNKIMEEELSS